MLSQSVLLVDDEPAMRTALNANFLRHGWRVEVASGVRDAERILQRASFDLVLTDVRMKDGDGFEILDLVRSVSPMTAVILLTAFGSVSDAVESMRNGAFDYLTKPVAFDQVQSTARRVIEKARAQVEQLASNRISATSETMEAQPAAEIVCGHQAGIVGRSPRLLQALERARAAAATEADVLVEAESGCGKELLARFIHEQSARAGKPFVAINCAAVPENLIESELFGHARGAFTGASASRAGKFEMADGGTLLLDEIGEMPLTLQPKLLRVLQEREFERLGESRTQRVNVRVIATTNASLASMVEQGTFRSDLYYRLNVIPLSLPPLRDRKDDIPALAQFFARKFASSSSLALPALDVSFLEKLSAHDWPGNVRELGNFMRRVLSLYPGRVIDASCFDREFDAPAKPVPVVDTSAQAGPVPGTPFADVERMHLVNTLALARGNRTHAAEMLGVSLRTVRNKIREYGLPPRSYA